MQNHHPLVAEFPEYKDKIHNMKIENNHFRKLAFEYEGIDKAIVRIEQGVENASDDYLNMLRRERLALKDILYSLLKA